MTNKKHSSKDLKPKFMITYLCRKCGFDFAITELDKPKCFYCESSKDWEIVKKQKLTPEVMSERLKLVADRMMENLKKAHSAGKETNEEFDETELLKVMAKASKLRKNIQHLKLEKNKIKPNKKFRKK